MYVDTLLRSVFVYSPLLENSDTTESVNHSIHQEWSLNNQPVSSPWAGQVVLPADLSGDIIWCLIGLREEHAAVWFTSSISQCCPMRRMVVHSCRWMWSWALVMSSKSMAEYLPMQGVLAHQLGASAPNWCLWCWYCCIIVVHFKPSMGTTANNTTIASSTNKEFK